MLAKYLWEIGALIFAFLGSMHLYLTFLTNAFSSKNEKMVDEMKISSPILSPKINMWKAWIGFNGSHSSGVMFIGIVNFYLAVRYFSVLQSDHFFFLSNILTVGFYVWVARKYWFNIPFTGVSITFACFIFSYVLTVLYN
ncbi:LIC_13387 family protein [Spirosoma harenae]